MLCLRNDATSCLRPKHCLDPPTCKKNLRNFDEPAPQVLSNTLTQTVDTIRGGYSTGKVVENATVIDMSVAYQVGGDFLTSEQRR